MERPSGRLAFARVTEKVLLASDGGAASAAALRWVIERVGYGSTDVHIVDVVDPSGSDAAERHAGVQGMAGLLGLFAPFVHLTVSTGGGRLDALDELEALAASPGSLLVLGVHRRDHRGTRLAERALERTRGPVVVVPAEWICRPGPVVVGIGAEDDLPSTLAFAEATAAASRSELHVVHVWETTGTGEIPPEWDFGTDSIPERQQRALAKVARLARDSHPGLSVTAEAVEGRVVPRLVEAARAASLLVVGRTHRTAVVGAIFGSAARRLLTELPCPVAVVP